MNRTTTFNSHQKVKKNKMMAYRIMSCDHILKLFSIYSIMHPVTENNPQHMITLD